MSNEQNKNAPLNKHVPPKTPIDEIQTYIDYCLEIVKALQSNNPSQYDAKENAKAALTLFQEHQLHELREAFEQ